MTKLLFWTKNVKSENFMHCDWSEEKFLKGSVGHKIRLRFWNKCQMTDLLFRQQASYSHVLAREFSISLLRLKEFYLLVKFSGSAKLHIATFISGDVSWTLVKSSCTIICGRTHARTGCHNSCVCDDWLRDVAYFYLKNHLNHQCRCME